MNLQQSLVDYWLRKIASYLMTLKSEHFNRKTDATDDEIIEALKIANAYEFVNELPRYTNIGDSGNKLSGGQNKTFYRSCRIENLQL
jgi:subfamily B ATP-binding cassette protein MsbA